MVLPRYGKGIEVLDTIDNSFNSIMLDSRSKDDERHSQRLGAVGNILQNGPIICGGLRRDKLPGEYHTHHPEVENNMKFHLHIECLVLF